MLLSAALKTALMRIVVTGVPGTGKTEVSGLLAKRMKCKVLGVTKLINERNLWKGKDKFGTKVALMARLAKALSAEMGKSANLVVEGHLACEFALPADLVVVLRTDPDVLEARLGKRGYPKEKADENVFAEMLDYCTICAIENYGRAKVIELDTTSKDAGKSASDVMALVMRKKKPKRIDWTGKLEERLSRPSRPKTQRGKARKPR